MWKWKFVKSPFRRLQIKTQIKLKSSIQNYKSKIKCNATFHTLNIGTRRHGSPFVGQKVAQKYAEKKCVFCATLAMTCISGCVSAYVALPANGVHNVRSDTHLLSSEYILICSQTYSLDAKSARVFRAFSLAVESTKKKKKLQKMLASVGCSSLLAWMNFSGHPAILCQPHTAVMDLYFYVYTFFNKPCKAC